MTTRCRLLKRLVLLAVSLAATSALAAGPTNTVLEATGVQGGLVVQLGCDELAWAADLARRERFLVQCLDTDEANVQAAREQLLSMATGCRVSVDRFDGKRLPYIDGLVNLLIAEDLGDVPMEEVHRVLCPRGVAYVKQGEKWAKTVKPWPDAIDEWTHYLHGPDNNAVGHDERVGVPFHAQWVAGPKWARHHNHLSGTSAMVSAGGRVFSIMDEGPVASLAAPPVWRLVARDAFSGVRLWKKPIGPWEGILRPFRSGPTELARRLVAVGETVYVTPGYGRPVVALDGATGEVVRAYAAAEGAVEILCDDGVLYVVTGTIDPQQYAEARRRGAPSPAPRSKRILALEADSGELLWQKSDADTEELLPTTLCIGGGHAFFQSIRDVVCLDATTGQVEWKAPRPIRVDRLSWSTPTLVVHGGVVLSADCAAPGGERRKTDGQAQVRWTVTARPENSPAGEGELIALSAADGNELWRCPTAHGYNAPPDVFVADGLVWASYMPGRNEPDLAVGRDLKTGEVKRRLETDPAFTTTHHHRCYRNKATDRFIVLGRTGVEWIDLKGEEPVRHCWVRGACQYGVMPAGGLLYAPPHACACYIQSKLSGFWAPAPRREGEKGRGGDKETGRQGERERLTRGPAYQLPSVHPSSFILHPSEDWPTYRHDAGRTGRTESTVSAKLRPVWQAELGGRLTSPVVAEGTLLVAAVDTHTLYALDSETGEQRWHYTAGGRIDSPPTIVQVGRISNPSPRVGRIANPSKDKDGLAIRPTAVCIFGSADGHVYCLRLSDGQLAWRFRAAPEDRRMVAFEQVESLWPATGSVLVLDGEVWCTSGRSSFLDGGMNLCRLDLATGKLLGETRFDSRDPRTGNQPEEIIEDTELPGALPDVLVYDGENVYLRDKVLDLKGNDLNTFRPHLYSSAGLLDDNWWHRTYWIWGDRTWGRASGWSVISRYRPNGRMLVADESTVFGYGRTNVGGNTLQGYHLFRADKEVTPIDKPIKNNNLALTRLQKPAKVHQHWSREVPMVARAMVLAGDVLLAAGPVHEAASGSRRRPYEVREPTFTAESPAVLMTFDTQDGSDRSRLEIDAQPVFDGMAVAGGRLFMSTVDGKVTCFGGK